MAVMVDAIEILSHLRRGYALTVTEYAAVDDAIAELRCRRRTGDSRRLADEHYQISQFLHAVSARAGYTKNSLWERVANAIRDNAIDDPEGLIQRWRQDGRPSDDVRVSHDECKVCSLRPEIRSVPLP